RGNDAEPADAFRLPPAWAEQEARTSGAAAAAPSRPEPASPRVDLAAEFTQRHKIGAVMLNPRGSLAIVDDERITVGESIEGWKLVSVAERTAVFEFNGVRAELRIETPSIRKSARPVIGTQPKSYTDDAATVSPTGIKTGNYIYGPYLRDVPTLPVGAGKGGYLISNTSGTNVGWIYDATNGSIKANCPNTEVDAKGKQY